MLEDFDLQLAVGRAHVTTDMAFFRSVLCWRNGQPGDGGWQVHSQGILANSTLLGDEASILVDSDCTSHLQVGSQSLVHIHGDLHGQVELNGMSELIVAGDVSAEAKISTSGIVSVFIGGNCTGCIESDDTLRLCVHGDFDGLLLTGKPSAHVSIKGDCTGAIRPKESAALLWLMVGGYTPFRVLQDTAQFEYTQFEATLEACNRRPGFYPDDATRKQFEKRRSHLLWVVHREQLAIGRSH